MKTTLIKERQQECTKRVMAWLHTVWEITERDSGDPLQADPFYARNAKLTPEVVADVLGHIEGLMQKEFDKYPGYHYPRNSVVVGEVLLVPPGFNQLPYQEQFAIVQGIDKIFQDYRVENDPPPPPPIEVATGVTPPAFNPQGEYWGC